MCLGWAGGPLADELNDLRAWPVAIDGQARISRNSIHSAIATMMPAEAN